MTMHMEKAYLTTTGKRKGKHKFRTAEQANMARRNAETWNELLEKYDAKVVVDKSKSVRTNSSKGVASYRNDWRSRVDPSRLTDNIPSLNSDLGVAVKAPDKVYTGDAMIGISVLHKSNGIPVFRDEDIKDISKMRRG